MKKRVLIISTKENYAWLSMQEILPAIEEIWINLDQIDAEIVYAENVTTSEMIKKLIQADLFVITAFNLHIAKHIQLMRKVLRLKAPLWFYVHNLATIYMWPLVRWGIEELLTEEDVFVSTCKRDKQLLEEIYNNAKVIVHPFYTNWKIENEQLNQKDLGKNSLVYIGRISLQKNLHTLIWAYSIAKSQNPEIGNLYIYGKEDDLGSPNMGLSDKEYLKYLKEVACNTGISENVFFEGYVPREKLYQEIDRENYVFITASLHSDENFGMALLKSLEDGKRCIASDWGGHADFKEFFKTNLKLIDVNIENTGISLNIKQLVNAIMSITSWESKKNDNTFYSRMNCQKIILEHVRYSGSSELIERTEVAKSFVDKIPQGYETKIYRDYCDEYAQVAFKKYGAVKNVVSMPNGESFFISSPSVEFHKDIIKIKSNHREVVELVYKRGKQKIIFDKNTSIDCSDHLVKKMLELNHCYALESSEKNSIKNLDKCHRSIRWIMERCNRYFRENEIENIYYTDYEERQPVDTNQLVNVVIFGSYYRRLLESGNWNFKKIKLWVLSKKVKKYLINTYSISSNVIKVIPRNELYKDKLSKKLEGLSGKNLVYAGRISEEKNIRELVKLVHVLQNNYSIDIGLKLIGDVEKNENPFYENSPRHLEEYIEHALKEWSWKKKPEMFPLQEQDKWLETLDKEKDVIVSLSTFVCEDFGVSIAQALEKGFYTIISDWGGHSDYDNDYIIKIPSSYLMANKCTFTMFNLKIKYLAKYLVEKLEKTETVAKQANSKEETSHEEILIENLDELRRNMAKDNLEDSMKLMRNELANFSIDDQIIKNIIRAMESDRSARYLFLVREHSDELFINYELNKYGKTLDVIDSWKFETVLSAIKSENIKHTISYEKIFVTDKLEKYIKSEKRAYLLLGDKLEVL